MTSTEFRDVLQGLLAGVGSNLDVRQVEEDEHLRYQAYKEVVKAKVGVDGVDEFIRILGLDPDVGMASAAATYLVDFSAGAAESVEEFTVWTQNVARLPGEFEFAKKRVDEWILFKGVQRGGVDVLGEVGGASDWLQRKVASESGSVDALEFLAESGRTKRIRRMAKEGLERLTGDV